MQLRENGVTLESLIQEFKLEVVFAPEGFEKIMIVSDDVSRPGLQLAGFFDYFDPNRIQIIGKAEIEYLRTLDDETRRHNIFVYMDKRCIVRIPS